MRLFGVRVAVTALLAAVLALQALQPAAADDAAAAGGAGEAQAAGYYKTSAVAISKYDASTKRYLPVATDTQYTYYRLHVSWKVLVVDIWDPDPSNPTLFQSVRSSLLYDVASGVEVGITDNTVIITSFGPDPSGSGRTTMTRLTYGVVELGPSRDDAFTYQGTLEVFADGASTILDKDIAITGGTGQFLGAFGRFVEFPQDNALTLNNTATSQALEVIVPRIKTKF